MKPPHILVAGLGNLFFADDGFGGETVQALLRGAIPAQVRVKDFGIRSYDLACALVDGYDAVVFVDATHRGQPPGTLCLLELDPPGPPGEKDAGVDGHSLDPVAVLRLAARLGTPASRLYLVGCEPAVLESDDGEIGLSPPVRAAVPRAVEMIHSLLSQLVSPPPAKPGELLDETGPTQGSHHERMGDSRNRDRNTRADRTGEDVAGNPALPAHA